MENVNITSLIRKYWGYVLTGILLIIAVCVIGNVVSVKETYKVVCLGDSILGNVRDETSVTGILEELVGEKAFNGGFGGMNLAYTNVSQRGDVQKDSFSLVGIAESMVASDFSWQNANLGSSSAMTYYARTISDFEDVDLKRVEVIVIEYGVNDYLDKVPLDDESRPYSRYTYGGALRYVLRLFSEEYPEKRVILLTPTFCWFPEENKDCRADNGHGSLEDYVNLEKKIAEEFDVEIIDNYHESGIGLLNESWSVYTVDGIHLNESGRRLIAGRIAECIQK